MALFGKPKSKKEEETKEQEAGKAPVSAVDGDFQEAVAPQTPPGGDQFAYGVILSSYSTEKAAYLGPLNKYIFKVARDANKIEIKKAINKLYKVEVKDVNIMNMPSKFRQVGRYQGRKSGFRKAIVTLKEGYKIDLV